LPLGEEKLKIGKKMEDVVIPGSGLWEVESQNGSGFGISNDRQSFAVVHFYVY
jgi:hypothetical protein